MKNEFKLGDILRFNAFIGPSAGAMESFHNDGLKAGDFVKVTEFFPHNGAEAWLKFGGAKCWHPECNFELVSEGVPDMITVILRRQEDEKAVLQALENLGIEWRGGDKATSWSPWVRGSRVINIHVHDNELGASPSSGSKVMKPNDIEKSILKARWHSYENVMFLNTKPSVKLVVSNLTTILT